MKKTEDQLLKIVKGKCSVAGKSIGGWKNLGIKVQGAIDGLVHYFGYHRSGKG